ncbi:hypothetical protein NW066_04395 [Mycoplasmopsis felis]|nr:hypothetical protein [Mycoplasmopsis felis]UWV84808.1 hypothetical protein NW066_04395 [Mycoplasmopsis felis]
MLNVFDKLLLNLIFGKTIFLSSSVVWYFDVSSVWPGCNSTNEYSTSAFSLLVFSPVPQETTVERPLLQTIQFLIIIIFFFS